MELSMISIGKRIKDRRKTLQLTQTDIKSTCGISSGALSEIENGKRTPSIVLFYMLSQVLKCSMDWLATGEYPDSENADISVSRDKNSDVINKFIDGLQKIDADDQEELVALLEVKLRRIKRDEKDMVKSSHSGLNQSDKFA